MRYYDLTITDSKGNPLSDRSHTPLSPLSGGQSTSGMSHALNIVFDIFSTSLDITNGGSVLTVYGLPMDVITQDVNLFGGKVSLVAGFSGGLPLERAEQHGMILQGDIWNCTGNWQGVNQALSFIINPGVLFDDNNSPLRITMDGKRGEKLSDILKRVLSRAYPRHQLEIQIRDTLVLPEDWTDTYTRPTQLAAILRSASKGIITEKTYRGVSLIMDRERIRIHDDLGRFGEKEIQASEIIGQPTWINWSTLSIKTPLRGDLMCGDIIRLPASIINGSSSLLSVNSPESYAWNRSSLAFNGEFQICSVRHVGDYYNASGEAWATIIEAWLPTIGDKK